MEHVQRAVRLSRASLVAFGYAMFAGLCSFLCHLYLPARLGIVVALPHALLVSCAYASAHLWMGLRRGRTLGWAEPHALLFALAVGLLSFGSGLAQGGLAQGGLLPTTWWGLLGGVVYPLLVSGVIPIFGVLIGLVIDDLRRPIA